MSRLKDCKRCYWIARRKKYNTKGLKRIHSTHGIDWNGGHRWYAVPLVSILDPYTPILHNGRKAR